VDFLNLQGGTVTQGRMGELKGWLDVHEGELRDTAPEGTEYIGTYVAVFTSEKDAGAVFTVMRMDSYGAMDRIAASPGSRFGELVNELIEFFDQSATAPTSSILLKALTDATLWGES